MAYRYKLTPLAIADTDDALDYIVRRLINPIAADNLYRAIQRGIDSICSSPFTFPDCSCYLIEDRNTRHSVNGGYILICEVFEAEGTIKVLRFLYGGKDITHTEIAGH